MVAVLFDRDGRQRRINAPDKMRAIKYARGKSYTRAQNNPDGSAVYIEYEDNTVENFFPEKGLRL